jgi:glycosyltransferase involved in cell wall biosynthesis
MSLVFKKQPLISVYVTTYQHVNFIRECLDSILIQSTTYDYEIVIGEDASTDDTREICMEYAKKYPDKIRLFLRDRESTILYDKNGKFYKSLNGAFTLFSCRGKYIAICEGDDYWIDPLKLQKQVDFLEANPDYVVCYHNINTVNENSQVINPSFIDVSSCRDYTQDELKRSFFMHPLSMCFRNCIKELSSVFKKMPSGDTFLISLLGHYGKGKYMDNIGIGASYRIHKGGVWNSNDNLNKILFLSKSFMAISLYYKNTQEEELQAYFKDRYRWKIKEAIQIAKKERRFLKTISLYKLLWRS